jgi:hypothetical protein
VSDALVVNSIQRYPLMRHTWMIYILCSGSNLVHLGVFAQKGCICLVENQIRFIILQGNVDTYNSLRVVVAITLTQK